MKSILYTYRERYYRFCTFIQSAVILSFVMALLNGCALESTTLGTKHPFYLGKIKSISGKDLSDRFIDVKYIGSLIRTQTHTEIVRNPLFTGSITKSLYETSSYDLPALEANGFTMNSTQAGYSFLVITLSVSRSSGFSYLASVIDTSYIK